MIELVSDLTPDTKTLRGFRDRVAPLIIREVEQTVNREAFIRSMLALAVDARAEGIRDSATIAARMLEIEGVAVWGGGFMDRFNQGYTQALRDIQTQLSREFQDKNGFQE